MLQINLVKFNQVIDVCSFSFIQSKSILDCPEAPCVPNAEIIEKFGLYRNVGRGIKYRCQTGFHMTGSPFTADNLK
jgi:hypothetical protein